MNASDASRPDPEALLRQVEAAEEFERRGRLKIFLGYASGVGKSFRMFDEGRRRRARGQDVVVGGIQPKTEPEVADILAGIEVVPLLEENGVTAIDVSAILKRHPRVCLIDGLAYDNPPGRPNRKRWQDVEDILEAGISVITSLNLGHIEERSVQVGKITGRNFAQTVPLGFIQKADEIVVVDAPAEFCVERGGGGSRANSAGLTLEQQLSELREIALLLAADVVDQQLEQYLERHGIDPVWGAQERILVCITPRANAKKMVESGQRTAARFHGELFAVYVSQPQLTEQDRNSLHANLEIARRAGAQIELLEGADFVDAVLRFAHGRGVTQIFVGHTLRKSWLSRFTQGPLDRLIRQAEDIDVRVFPH